MSQFLQSASPSVWTKTFSTDMMTFSFILTSTFFSTILTVESWIASVFTSFSLISFLTLTRAIKRITSCIVGTTTLFVTFFTIKIWWTSFIKNMKLISIHLFHHHYLTIIFTYVTTRTSIAFITFTNFWAHTLSMHTRP
jgi:hypothetical protein